jgi:hypothetical protein
MAVVSSRWPTTTWGNAAGARTSRPGLQADVALAADLLAGNTDPRPGAPALLRRALAALPEGVGQIKLRADAGYFAVDLAIAAHRAGITFAIGAKRIAALWRTLATVGKSDWVDAIDMPGAQVAVANYIPVWGPLTPTPGAATVHVAPRPAHPAHRRTRGGRRGLWPLVHPDQLRRVHTGEGRCLDAGAVHRCAIFGTVARDQRPDPGHR